MAGKILQAAVVGASTLLGKELVQEISQSAAAAWDLRLLEESDEAEGQLTSAGDEAIVIHKLSEKSLEGIDVLFFADTTQATLKYADAAVRAGGAIIDLTGALGGRPGFLVRSPWIEAGQRPDLTTAGIVTPHPAALMLGLVAERLERQFGLTTLAATLLEPASQAGAAGVDELHQQTVGLLSFQEVPKQVFGTQVAFNLQSALGEEAQVVLAATRERITKDLLAITNDSLAGTVSYNLLQAPVFHGYVASTYVSVGRDATEEQLRSALKGGIVVTDPDTVPSNQAAAESGDLLVGVQADTNRTDAFWLVLAADNLRLSARNAVEAALELAALRPAARVQ